MTSPAGVLRERLVDARRRGEVFDRAWPPALAAALQVVTDRCERDTWAELLCGMASSWRDAWLRRPATSREEALGAAVAEREQGAPLPDRPCEVCDEPIPPERDRNGRALYCSERCKERAREGMGAAA